MKRAIGLRHL